MTEMMFGRSKTTVLAFLLPVSQVRGFINATDHSQSDSVTQNNSGSHNLRIQSHQCNLTSLAVCSKARNEAIYSTCSRGQEKNEENWCFTTDEHGGKSDVCCGHDCCYGVPEMKISDTILSTAISLLIFVILVALSYCKHERCDRRKVGAMPTLTDEQTEHSENATTQTYAHDIET